MSEILSSDLGPLTEARFREAFADRATITADAAARLLGLHVKTLRAMTEDLTIRAVRRGRCRSYTEADLRSYLSQSKPPECRSPKNKPPPAPRKGKVVPFSQLAT